MRHGWRLRKLMWLFRVLRMSSNVRGIRRLGGLTEPAQMWVNEGVGAVGDLAVGDLAVVNPGGGACRRRSVYRLLNDVRPLFSIFSPISGRPCTGTYRGVNIIFLCFLMILLFFSLYHS